MRQSNSKSFIDNNRDIYTERRIQIKKFGFVICGINWSIGLTGLRKISKIGVLGTILFLPMGMGGGPTVVGSERWAVVRCSNVTLSLPDRGGLFIFSKNANLDILDSWGNR
jgi:hypothetical protein